MCVCTPGIKTPYCGRPGCTWPERAEEPINQGNQMQPVKLGNIVEDVVSGLKGTAVAVLEPMTGMKQIGIQPKGDGSAIPDSTFIDEYLVEWREDGIAARVPPVAETSFTFGQEVRDIASGQVGQITNKITYLNGCVHFGVTTNSRANKNPEVFYIDCNRLELVSDGVKEKVPPKSDDAPGGPMTRMNSVKAR